MHARARNKPAALRIEPPGGLRPKFTDRKVPDGLPTAAGRPPSRMAIELRRHLPEKVPPEWGVPVAMPNGDGWMFEAPPFLALVGFCTVGERVKVIVTLIGPEGEERNEVEAMSVLREFRNARDSSPRAIRSFRTCTWRSSRPAGCTPGRRPTRRSRLPTKRP